MQSKKTSPQNPEICLRHDLGVIHYCHPFPSGEGVGKSTFLQYTFLWACMNFQNKSTYFFQLNTLVSKNSLLYSLSVHFQLIILLSWWQNGWCTLFKGGRGGGAKKCTLCTFWKMVESYGWPLNWVSDRQVERLPHPHSAVCISFRTSRLNYRLTSEMSNGYIFVLIIQKG